MDSLLFGLGFHTAPFTLHFEREPDYGELLVHTGLIDIISGMTNSNICILDFYKHTYFYVSKNHLFMCGHNSEETMRDGESTAEEIIFQEDKETQLHMKDAACLFFASFEPQVQREISLFTNHRLKHKNGSIFMVSNQYKPILFDDNGKMWMSLCITNFGTKNLRVESYIEMNDRRYVFSPRKRQFVLATTPSLTKREREILFFSAHGFTIKDIAANQNISTSTVKFHRQNILGKLNVQNISEAILYAESHNIL